MKAEEIRSGTTYIGGKLGRTRTVTITDATYVFYYTPFSLGCAIWPRKAKREVFARWATGVK